MMEILLKRGFLLLYTAAVCIAVQYECDNRNTLCGCGYRHVQLPILNVIGSEDAIPNSWSMIVSIRGDLLSDVNQQHSCAGTILTNRYILTAARCVQNRSSWEIMVVPQPDRLLTEPLKTYQVDRIHQHPNFRNRGENFENDIALLHLTESLEVEKNPIESLTCVPKISSPIDLSQYPSNKARLAIIGWRITEKNQSYMSDKLQQAEIFVINSKDHKCSNSSIDPNRQFCAGFEEGRVDACPGDSGGPVLQWMNGYWDQVGIISSTRCNVNGQASMYTRLAYYYDWMMSILNYDNETITTIQSKKAPVIYHCNKKNVTCGCGYTDVEITQSRIMNGEDAVEASWTMFVSLRILNSSKHICGGTLLSNTHILTAAHCVRSFPSVDPSDLTIVAGITNQFDSVRYIRKIRRITIHPNFTDQTNTFLNDIAILEIDYRLLIDSNPVLSKTCIPNQNSSISNNKYPINGTSLVVIGWGTTKYEQYVEPEILQQAEVFVIDEDHPLCSNLISDVDEQFCAGSQDSKGPCQGDSGGPIFQWTGQYWDQVGIVSYGDGCTESGSPQIYTRISTYVDWINQVINTLDVTSTSIRPSTSPRPNCALKHQLNIILFIVLISLIKN